MANPDADGALRLSSGESPLPPPPTPFAAWAFDYYLRRQARRYFTTVHWRATSDPSRWDRAVPTLFVANHTNWWDGFLAALVTREIGLTFRILMEAANLARYRAFLLVGAIPLRRGAPREAYANLVSASRAITGGTGVWIFPQGERRPAREPIGRCERGAAQLALLYGSPLRLCPVAFRYSFLSEQLPEAFIGVGEPRTVDPARFADRRALMPVIEGALSETVARLDTDLDAERIEGFRPLVRGKLSVNKRMDRFRHAVGLLPGRFQPRNG